MRAILIALLSIGAAFAGTPPKIYAGRLVNYAEQRYNEQRARYLGGKIDSCVDRDYTVQFERGSAVLRESTCLPGWQRGLQVTIGQDIQVAEDTRGRVGIVDTRGKVHWMRLFVTRKD